MGYIIVLCLSGSMMEIIYFFLKHGLKGKLSTDWQYRIMKGVILFYLIPLPFLKWLYRAVMGCFLKPLIEGMIHIYSNKSLIVYYGRRLVFNQTFEEQCRVLGIWLLVAMGILAWQYVRYLRNDIRLGKYGNKFVDEADAGQIEQLRWQYAIKRKVRSLGSCNDYLIGEVVFTTGFIRPMIVCFSKMQGRKRNMVLEHEIVHVKRWDIFWKLLLVAAQIIHWYNPLVWLLTSEFDRVCEMSCDDQVLQGKGEREKREYSEMLLTMVMENQEGRSYSLGLSKNGKQLKERIDNVMKEKKKCFGKLVSAYIFVVTIFLNSLTAFAYEDVQFTKVPEGNERQLEMMLYSDIAFVPGGEEETMQNLLYDDLGMDIYVIYESQFTNELGNVYQISSHEPSVYTSCSHSYIIGETQNHIKCSDVSCEIAIRDAKYCTKCGSVQVGEEKQRVGFKPCPH